MRLSDVRCRKPKPLYLNHSIPPDPTGAATRCSNRLLASAGVPPRQFIGRRRPPLAGLTDMLRREHNLEIRPVRLNK